MNTPQPRSRHLSRRALVQGATLGAAAYAVMQPDSMLAAMARQTPAPDMPSAKTGLSGTPLGDQLDWLLAFINAGVEAVDSEDLKAHLSPSFLTTLPEEQFLGFVQQIGEAYSPLEAQGLLRPPTDHQAVALVNGNHGAQVALAISIEHESPYQITGANPYPLPTADGAPLAPIGQDEAGGSRTGRLFDVDGRKLYLSSAGVEDPTVVFEAGLGDSAAGWAAIESAVASFARVCSYDRANAFAGASDPAPAPRTAEDVVADLHSLLDVAEVPGPYVFVGHSFGGVVARLYASRYPEDVVGLVFVDASHEDQVAGLESVLTEEQRVMMEQIVNGNPEGIDFVASLEEMRAARESEPLQEMPVFVLTAGQSDDPALLPPDWPFEAEAALWTELQEDLAGLVPGSRHVVAEESGHYIHQSDPGLVVEAIRAVVAAVTDPDSWATPSSATPST